MFHYHKFFLLQGLLDDELAYAKLVLSLYSSIEMSFQYINRDNSWNLTKERLKVLSILLIFVFASLLFIRYPQPHGEEDWPKAATQKMLAGTEELRMDYSRRPTMYTFFDRIPATERNTGMTDADDDKMLFLWAQEWEDSGFNTFVLSMEDAKKHPRFFEFEEKLQKVPLNGRNKVYNQMCYYRHLAMSVVGGGHMSDYDVLPLLNYDTEVTSFPRNIAQDGGASIIYSATADNGGIPCLMSGGASAWEELAFALLENAARHANEQQWSDMYAMVDLKDSSVYQLQDAVIKFSDTSESDPKRCDFIARKIAIHFSHHALKKVQKTASDRPSVAEAWLQQWRKFCEAV